MSLFNLAKITFLKLGFKPIKYWIDNTFRDKVTPIKGSVLYTDLYLLAEHSGIYIGNEKISNIVVDSLVNTEATVRKSSVQNFTDGGILHGKIYVSCNNSGAVGDQDVSEYAYKSIGKKSFYGLVFSNCHSFSKECVEQCQTEKENSISMDTVDTWEPTINILKYTARQKLGATKWRLWDGQGVTKNEDKKVPPPSLKESIDELENAPLDEESIKEVSYTHSTLTEYLKEIEDEEIPKDAVDKLKTYEEKLEKVEQTYEKSKEFIKEMGQPFTYQELKSLKSTDFLKLARELKSNQNIQKIVEKLGRNYISKEKKETVVKRVPNEVHSIYKSNELARLLPSELSSCDDEDMEYLFYAKYLERNLLTYQLDGNDVSVDNIKTKGPIVACLDTSGSMDGTPLLKARALLFAISKILKKEKRDMHVLLFGTNNQLVELYVSPKTNIGELLIFLGQKFNGGTNFETPLKRSFEIVEENQGFNNADVLMITDGECSISQDFRKAIVEKKRSLNLEIYTIMCKKKIIEDSYSSEVICI